MIDWVSIIPAEHQGVRIVPLNVLAFRKAAQRMLTWLQTPSEPQNPRFYKFTISSS